MRLLAVLLAVILFPGLARAHSGMPIALTVQQLSADTFHVETRLPPTFYGIPSPTIDAPPGCRVIASRSASEHGPQQAISGTGLLRCDGPLSGAVLKFNYAEGYTPTLPTLLRMEWISGESRSLLIAPGQDSVVVPEPEKAGAVAYEYGRLGMRHILEGYDHLLFLICLLFIARKRILLTVTGFTIGHAVSITAAALGVVGAPQRPVETAIAVSIMFMAAELVRSRRDTLTWRWPVVVSTSFGILHGFGFATALQDMGLPQTEVPLALLSFNVGIEVGQLAFVLACLTLWAILRAVTGKDRDRRPLELAVGSIAGCVAAFWAISRTIGPF